MSVLGITRPRVLVLMAAAIFASAAGARGQSSSMYGDPAKRATLTLSQTSYQYQTIEPPKELKLHDLVTVLVDESSQVISEGELDRRKKAEGKYVLTDWIGFDGWAIRPDPQSAGDPTVAGKMENKYRAEGGLETSESMKFRIACEIVDIRPNGLLVLEGTRDIRNNHEQWELSLSGTVRPEDILPDNTVISENVAGLRILKREAGAVRDGYRRGWFQRIFDRWQPF